MPKYSVRIDARIIHPVTTVSATIEVEADNEEAAEDKAREQAEAGDVEWQHVDDNAFEVAHLFENGNVLAEDMNIQLHAPPRSRRSSSSVPDIPTSVKLISNPRTARTASSLREPNSVSCPRSNRTRDSRVKPERLATSL